MKHLILTIHSIIAIFTLQMEEEKVSKSPKAQGGNEHFVTTLFYGREDQTRTGDHTPPRRVRYQLRYFPKPWAFWLTTLGGFQNRTQS